MVLDDGSGNAPAAGGGASSAALALTIEDVEKIGQDTAALTSRAQTARTKLASAKGAPGDFSNHPAAQALYTQHQAVVEVFEKTLDAVTTDLDDFGATIVQAARNHAQTDSDVLATLTTLAASVTNDRLTQARDDARNEAGQRLRVEDLDLDTDAEIDSYEDAHEDVQDSSLDALRPGEAPGSTSDAAGGPQVAPADGFELPGVKRE